MWELRCAVIQYGGKRSTRSCFGRHRRTAKPCAAVRTRTYGVWKKQRARVADSGDSTQLPELPGTGTGTGTGPLVLALASKAYSRSPDALTDH